MATDTKAVAQSANYPRSVAWTRHILLLGSGFVAAPAADYILRRPENRLTVASAHLKNAEALAKGRANTTAAQIDVKDEAALDQLVARHDLVISLVPWMYHAYVLKSAIKNKKNVVTTSYVTPVMMELDEAAKEAGITVINEVGLDPGIDHFYALKMIDEVHAQGGKILSFLSYCGGLPAPESSNNPLGYKFSWSPRGVLMALRATAKYLGDGKEVAIPAGELLRCAKPIFVYPAFAFEGYPNRDSTPYDKRYNIPEAHTILRGTLRYQALTDCGLLDDTTREDLAPGAAPIAWVAPLVRYDSENSDFAFGKLLMAVNYRIFPWLSHGFAVMGCWQKRIAIIRSRVQRDLLAGLLGTSNESSALHEAVSKRAKLSGEERQRILMGMAWLGLFSDKPVPAFGSVLDGLAKTLEMYMTFQPGERDMVMLQHKFEVELADGRKQLRTSTMLEYGEPLPGVTAMAKTVGVPCGITVQLVLDGVIKQRGILAPMSKEIYQPILELLEKEGIRCIEETFEHI